MLLKITHMVPAHGYGWQHMRYGDENGSTAEAGFSAFITKYGTDKYLSDHEVS